GKRPVRELQPLVRRNPATKIGDLDSPMRRLHRVRRRRRTPFKETLMSRSNRRAATMLVAACIATIAMGGTGQAQQPRQPAAPQPLALQQVAPTDQQIQGLLDSQRELDDITSKIPDDPAKPPDPKVIAQLDGIVKKHGFASYAEYGNVAANIDMLLDGFDPQTRKFVGFEAMLKSQIAQIQADSKIPAKDKKAALAELNASLK